MLFQVLTNFTNPQTEPHTDIATCTLNRPLVEMGLPITTTRLFIYVYLFIFFVRLSQVGRNPISSAGDNSFCEQCGGCKSLFLALNHLYFPSKAHLLSPTTGEKMKRGSRRIGSYIPMSVGLLTYKLLCLNKEKSEGKQEEFPGKGGVKSPFATRVILLQRVLQRGLVYLTSSSIIQI